MAVKKKAVKKATANDNGFNQFDFFKKVKTANKYVDENIEITTDSYIDSGSFAFNGVLTGDMTKGLPINRITMLAGEQQVGKSFLAQFSFCRPLAADGYFIYYIDSEGTLTEETIESFGLEPDQYQIIPEDIIENLKITLNKIVSTIEEKYEDPEFKKSKQKLKVAFVLDSQGQLDSLKARTDTEAGKNVVDLTPQKALKAMYKTVTKRMAMLDIPFLVTNHCYTNNMTFIPQMVVSGGQGGLYASSIIVHLRKKMYKEGKVRKGTILTAKTYKNRYCIDGIEAQIYLDFEKGLNRWYGLHLFAEQGNIIEKWSKDKFDKKGVVGPEKAGNFNWWVLKNPAIDPSKWIVCKENELHSKSTIGTIFDPINEWVKQTFKLTRPVDFSYDKEEEEKENDGLDLAESDILDTAEEPTT
jgi:RecA/RadA recombinase